MPEELHERHEYWAFISYRHADNQAQDRSWATWLHQEIERYEIPAELVGTYNDRGETIPERIYPLFRDEESLPAGSDLRTSIIHALDRSRNLIVLCSPRAIESRYVEEEIRYFIDSGRHDRIFAVIIDGQPGDPEQECLPHPLRQDGFEPIAADLRLPDGSEGFTSPVAYQMALQREGNLSRRAIRDQVAIYEERLESAKLKVIAGILGISIANLQRRDKAYQLALARRRARRLQVLAATFSILTGMAGFIAGSFYGPRPDPIPIGPSPPAPEVVDSPPRLHKPDNEHPNRFFPLLLASLIGILALSAAVYFGLRHRIPVTLPKEDGKDPPPDGSEFKVPKSDDAFSSQAVVSRFPAPIAHAYLRFRTAEEHCAKLLAMFAAFEAILRYLVTIGFCDLLASTPASRREKVFSHSEFEILKTKTKPALGHWIGLARGVGRELGKLDHSFVEKLPALLDSKGQFVARIADEFVTLRNDTCHPNGTIAITAEKARKVIRKKRHLLEQALLLCDFLRLYPLGFISEDQESLRPSTERIRPYLLHCGVGTEYASMEPYAFDTELILECDAPFIMKPDGSGLLYLWPLQLERRIPDSNQHSIYIFEHLESPFLTEAEYSAIDRSEETWTVENTEVPTGDFEWLWNEAKRLPTFLNVSEEDDLKPERLTPRTANLSGSKLHGGIELIALLGAGGFGSVYYAEDTKGKALAVKVMDTAAETQLKRFQQEFDRLRQASHERIIRCYELNEDTVQGRRCRWYSMEFAHGGDLTLQNSSSKGNQITLEQPEAPQTDSRRDRIHSGGRGPSA